MPQVIHLAIACLNTVPNCAWRAILNSRVCDAKVTSALPAERSPTVNPLIDENYVAVEVRTDGQTDRRTDVPS
jgi:HisG, C-terminal domain